MTPTHEPEAAVVARIAKEACEHKIVNVEHPDGTKAVLLLLPVNGGMTVHELTDHFDDFRTRPARREGTAHVASLESFVDHVKRFADADSVIFANRNPKEPGLVAVLNYHRATATGEPRFGDHRTHYGFPLSDEWTAWREMNGKTMSQEHFARWIEEHLADIAAPDVAGKGAKAFAELLSAGFASPQKLLELSRGLTVHVGGRVANHVNLSSGEATIIFEEKHADDKGAPIKVPSAFLLALPVFRAGAPYQIPVRLRYWVDGGQCKWKFDLFRADAVFDDAIDEACKFAKGATSLPLFMGTPEP